MLASHRHHGLIALILIAAIVARAFAFSPYAIHHPDEAIQYLEQAHRLVFGSGLVPWEYRFGMRSWLVPMLLAGPMWVGDAIAPNSLLYVVLPRLLFAAIALAPLWAAWTIGGRVSTRHGLVALAVIALWYESVYFSVHVLTEMLSTAMFLPAAALLLGPRPRHQLILAGALLGFAVIFRFHYGPAAAVLALWTLRDRWRDWGWLIVGAFVPAIVSGAVDLTMGQWPFAWMVENIRYNVIENKAAEFGEFGAEAYAQMLWLSWTAAIVPILWLSASGVRRFPVLGAVAAVNVLIHLAIGHKEYRFILLSTQIVILLAAIGSVDAVAGLRRWLGDRAPARNIMLVGAVGLWGVASLTLTLSDLSNPGWRRYAGGYQLARQAAVQRTCGVAIFAGRSWPPVGQLWLHADTPQYHFFGPTAAAERVRVAAAAHAFNAIIAEPARASVPRNYARVACAGDGADRLCLAVRPGTCTRSAQSNRQLIQRVMERNGR